jgi:hypothetical protein
MSDRTLLILGLQIALAASVLWLIWLAKRNPEKRWVSALFGFRFGPRSDVQNMTKQELLESAVRFVTWGLIFLSLFVGSSLLLEFAGLGRSIDLPGFLFAFLMLFSLFSGMGFLGGAYLFLRYLFRSRDYRPHAGAFDKLDGIYGSVPVSEARGIGPPWRRGQYVTYFLDRSDGSWAAFELTLHSRLSDGTWAIQGNFKNAIGESAMWFRTVSNAPEGEFDIVPAKEEFSRHWPGAEPQPGGEDPRSPIAVAMNILIVGGWKKARELARTEPTQSADFPCGVSRIHELVTDGPGYKKHHALNRRVMLTGVACLSIDSRSHPAVATSFGTSDPEGSGTPGDEDYVDLSNPKRIQHDGFALTYPATWFLRPDVDEEDRPVPGWFGAMVGGNACAVTCSVMIHTGTPEAMASERAEILSRAGSMPEVGGMRWKAREGVPLGLPGDAQAYAAELDSQDIQGLNYAGLFASPQGDRLAHVVLTGSVAKSNPNCATLHSGMEPVFGAILESFAFA